MQRYCSLGRSCSMFESNMAVTKPEAMKSYIWLQCADGSIQQVEEEVAMFCPTICREVLQKGMGSSKNYAISLPERVSPSILGLVLDYCRFHLVVGRSNKERKAFDEKFVKKDTKQLCELASAADGLQLKPLVDLTARALARIIEGKTPEEIRETFHIPDDLTEEEKLEPLTNATDDPRIRLLNRLYAKKRKELKERQKLKDAEVEEERVDERSVDDLLSFVNGDGDSKAVKPSKNKKKNKKKKDQDPSKKDADKSAKKDTSNPSLVRNETGQSSSRCESSEEDFTSKIVFDDDDDIDDELDPALKEELDRWVAHEDAIEACIHVQDTSNPSLVRNETGRSSSRCESSEEDFTSKIVFDDDDDIDDELDPALKEELDREVEDFARRLNSDWPQRMQEILSLGQERRRLVPNLMNGNGSLKRFTGLERK